MGGFTLRSAQQNADAGLVVGFATWCLTGFGRQLGGFNVTGNCEAADWWCSLVQGYVRAATRKGRGGSAGASRPEANSFHAPSCWTGAD